MTTVMELCSSATRGVLVASPGKKLVVADLSNIEGRVLAWLAGESWKLRAFREFDTQLGVDGKWYTGEQLRIAALAGCPVEVARNAKGDAVTFGADMYKMAYAKAFGISPDEVEDHQRQIGKVKELMLGYQGGVGAYLTGAASYNIDLEAMAEGAYDTIPAATIAEAEDFLEWQLKQGRGQYGLSDKAFIVCDSFKRLWRESNSSIASWWKELEETCRAAINHPGVRYTSRRLVIRRDGAWLRIALPSGRCLCYPSPRVDDDGKISYMGVHQYTRKWSRISTYGGKLAENVSQAVSRDVMGWSMPRIEAAGFEILLTVHDEVISETPDTDEHTHYQLAATMAAGEAWTEGLPLAAAGFESHRYRKG